MAKVECVRERESVSKGAVERERERVAKVDCVRERVSSVERLRERESE